MQQFAAEWGGLKRCHGPSGSKRSQRGACVQLYIQRPAGDLHTSHGWGLNTGPEETSGAAPQQQRVSASATLQGASVGIRRVAVVILPHSAGRRGARSQHPTFTCLGWRAARLMPRPARRERGIAPSDLKSRKKSARCMEGCMGAWCWTKTSKEVKTASALNPGERGTL